MSTYLLDAPPKTTKGEATWNPDTNTVTYYDELKEGNDKGTDTTTSAKVLSTLR